MDPPGPSAHWPTVPLSTNGNRQPLYCRCRCFRSSIRKYGSKPRPSARRTTLLGSTKVTTPFWEAQTRRSATRNDSASGSNRVTWLKSTSASAKPDCTNRASSVQTLPRAPPERRASEPGQRPNRRFCRFFADDAVRWRRSSGAPERDDGTDHSGLTIIGGLAGGNDPLPRSARRV
jgi:hypothetical protein